MAKVHIGSGIDLDFHKKLRITAKDQEKSQRNNSERTQAVNAISWGRLNGKPQDIALSPDTVLGAPIPRSFCLTINDLRLRCGTKWYEVVGSVELVGSSS